MNLEGIRLALLVSLIATAIGRAPSASSAEPPQRATATPGDDLPRDSIPRQALSVRFVVEHRSRLNGHTIRVRGIITAALVGEAACPPARGMCAPNSIFLADSDASQRDSLIRVLLPQDARPEDFAVGKQLLMKVVVHGNKVGVALTMQK